MGWPGVGVRRGLRRARSGEAFLAFCLPCLRARPFWRLDPDLEREVLDQLLERGE